MVIWAWLGSQYTRFLSGGFGSLQIEARTLPNLTHTLRNAFAAGGVGGISCVVVLVKTTTKAVDHRVDEGTSHIPHPDPDGRLWSWVAHKNTPQYTTINRDTGRGERGLRRRLIEMQQSAKIEGEILLKIQPLSWTVVVTVDQINNPLNSIFWTLNFQHFVTVQKLLPIPVTVTTYLPNWYISVESLHFKKYFFLLLCVHLMSTYLGTFIERI